LDKGEAWVFKCGRSGEGAGFSSWKFATGCPPGAKRAGSAALTTPQDAHGIVQLTLKVAEESIQKKAVNYDADGDAHYDTASALIKSMRGSDPDARCTGWPK